MSAVLAVLSRTGETVDSDVLAAMAAARSCRSVDGQDSWVLSSVGLLHQHFWVTPEEKGERQPILDPSGKIVLAADVRLDNRTELSRLLGYSVATEYSDAELILRAYLEWGTACAGHLQGDFAFVIWDGRLQQLFAAVDVLAARALVYYLTDRVAIFASEAVQVLAHPNVNLAFNEGRVAEFIVNCWDNLEETFFQDVFYLPAGHCMTVTADSMQRWRYTAIRVDQRIRYRGDAEYAEHYLSLLEECNWSRLRSTGPIAVSLSGGLDSTALAAIAARQLARGATAQSTLVSYTYGFEEFASCDERKYVRPVADQYNIDAHDVPCDDCWTLANWEDWPFDREFVLSDPYVLLQIALIREAAAGKCKVVLGGYYGDVLFTGGHYWLLGLLRELRLPTLAKFMMEGKGKFRWKKSLGDFGIRRLLPTSVRRAYRSFIPRKAELATSGIHPELIRRTDLEQRLASYHWWERWDRDEDSQRFHSLMLGVFSHGAASTRWMYHQHGLELETPYWDRRLIEFVMALPADQLGRPTGNRWVHRNAMNGLLPSQILERTDKTTFAPLFHRGFVEERPLHVREMLRKSRVADREWIRRDWLTHHLVHFPRQAGDLMQLWTSMCLEGWLVQHSRFSDL